MIRFCREEFNVFKKFKAFKAHINSVDLAEAFFFFRKKT